MKNLLVLFSSMSIVAGAVAMATPAQAYDKDAYAYAAAHMIQRSDIPAVLGPFNEAMSFNAGPGRGKAYLCSLEASTDGPIPQFSYPVGQLEYTANYSAKGKDAPSLWVSVMQYPSAAKAIAAFDVAKKQVKNCTGTFTNSWTDPDSGVVSTSTTQTTNGIVPSVSTLGVDSLFVSVNSVFSGSSEEAPFKGDQYQVWSLINDVIITTSYNMEGADNVSTQKRKAVNQVAFNAETAWLD